MTEHESQPPAPDHERESQVPPADQRQHRYEPDETPTADTPPVGTWHHDDPRPAAEGPGTADSPAPGPSAYPPPGGFPSGGSSDTDQTTAFGPFTFRPDPASPAPGTTTTRVRGRGRTAGVLVAALLLGSAGGVAGAAAFNATDDGSEGVRTVEVPTSTISARTRNEDTDLPAVNGSPEAVAAKVLPSVVKINVTGSGGAGSGSGVILSESGEILTNNHVVEVAADGGQMTVNFSDGTAATARVVKADPVTDLAVIQAENVTGLTPARLGNSDKLDIGQGVVAIGSPFGLTATVTSGIVSALNRPVSVSGEDGGDETTYPAIQTDAAINPGNSGGPLVNLAGQVVGINSSIRSSSDIGGQGGSIGLGFAIPISTVLPVVDQLRNKQTPTHARLGISVSDKGSNSDPTENGLIQGAGVEEVTSGSAGEKAGLEAGDVVTRVDDDQITSSESLVATIRGHRPGDKVSLTVLRDGKSIQLDATLDSDVESSSS